MCQRKNSHFLRYLIRGEEMYKNVLPFCGSHHLVFMFWLISIALFGGTLTNPCDVTEKLSREEMSVMFECFHFQHFVQVSQRYMFWFVLTNLFLQFNLLQQLLTFTENWLCFRELLLFPKGRRLFILCIILLFMCGTVEFQFVKAKVC